MRGRTSRHSCHQPRMGHAFGPCPGASAAAGRPSARQLAAPEVQRLQELLLSVPALTDNPTPTALPGHVATLRGSLRKWLVAENKRILPTLTKGESPGLRPRIGEVRLHEAGKRLACRVAAGTAVLQSVTVYRGGSRWYASVLAREQITVPDRPTRAQAAAGAVGVDVGVHHLAALSTGEIVPNPRIKKAGARALARAARAHARTQPGSGRRERARRRVARLLHLEAARRAGVLHGLTKRLATGWAVVAVEDLHVAGMTRFRARHRRRLGAPGAGEERP